MNTVPESRRGLSRLLRSTAGKAIAALTVFALVCVGVVVGVTTLSANAVETKGKYSGSGGSMRVTTTTKQAMQIECFSKIATKIKYLEPNVTRPVWAPKNITSTPEAFTPATADSEPFMQVLGTKKTGSMGTVPADMINTGTSVKLYKFVLYFKTPVANPRLNLAGTEMTQIDKGVPATSSGLSVSFSDAKAYTGKSATIVATNRISGIDDVAHSAYRIEGNTILTNTVACDGNSGGCGDNYAARLAAVKAKIPGVSQLTTPLRGTVELNTNGVPVSKVTVTVGATFFSAKSGAQSLPVPGLAIAPQFRSEVSAFQRTLGKYGSAMHAMPFVGTDNLKFGTKIVEGNRNTYTTDINSGTVTDNSDAGYDAQPTFYWESDKKKKTPVTSVTSADKGKWLMADIKVSSLRTDKTAYVYGFIDWTGVGDFAKVDKGKSTLGCVSKGNGIVTIKWKVPSKVTTGDINLRLRLSYDCCEIDKPTGTALSGEVEDWPAIFNQKKNNLKLAKAVTSGATAAPGDQVVFTLTVQNLDSKPTSKAVTVTDVLPAQLRDITIVPPTAIGTATVSGQTVTWQLPAGVSANASLKVSGTVVDTATAGDVTNTARLSDLCDSGNCEASATFTIALASGELQLTNQIESQTADPVKAGDRVSYVVTMAYHGDVPLSGFTFTDNLVPNNALWTCTTPIPTSVDPGWTNTCRTTYPVTEQDVRDNWDAGQLVNTARIAGTLSAAPGTELSKEASVATAIDTVTPRVEITGDKTADLASAVPGQLITYTITATNHGQLTATNVVLTDTFEGAAPVTIDPADCMWDGATGELAPGDSVTCTVEYTPTAAQVGETLVNTATAAANDGTDAYGPVELGQAEVLINAPAITIEKTNSLDGTSPSVHEGDTFTYTMTVTNSGTADAEDLRVIDELPAGLVLDPPAQPGWTVDPGHPQRVTSDPFSLAVGEDTELTLTVRVTADAVGPLTNMAVVDPMNTLAACRAAATAKGCGVDMNPPIAFNDPIAISKQSDVEDGEEISVGRLITYTLKVTNKSTQDATGVVVIDRLPSELEPYPTDQPGWTINGQTMTADAFDLGAGLPHELTLTARARVTTSESVRNWVVVSDYGLVPGGSLKSAKAAEVPPMTVDDCLAAQRDEARCAYADIPAIRNRSGLDAEVSSTAPAAVTAGDSFEYMILVVNTKAERATKVAVSHVLPSGLEYADTQESGWSIDGRTATISADIPANSAVAYWLNVKVTSGAAGPLQAFTMLDGALLTDCQANWQANGCVVDPKAPIAS